MGEFDIHLERREIYPQKNTIFGNMPLKFEFHQKTADEIENNKLRRKDHFWLRSKLSILYLTTNLICLKT